MSVIREVKQVKPICAVTLSEATDLSQVEPELIRLMGEIDDRSPLFPFSFTDYYREEMGDHLKKIFFSFRNVMEPGKLAAIKRATNDLEIRWSESGSRRVNLDPGYVTGAKLVLASAKDFAHRIYIGGGIYGDVQLQFRYHQFRVQKWTFPDYQTKTALAFFHSVREKFVNEEKEHESQTQL